VPLRGAPGAGGAAPGSLQGGDRLGEPHDRAGGRGGSRLLRGDPLLPRRDLPLPPPGKRPAVAVRGRRRGEAGAEKAGARLSPPSHEERDMVKRKVVTMPGDG